MRDANYKLAGLSASLSVSMITEFRFAGAWNMIHLGAS
jgi:hypothetical protein